MAGLPATGVMRSITFWPVNRPVVVKGLMKNKVKLLLKQLENYTQYSPIVDLSFD